MAVSGPSAAPLAWRGRLGYADAIASKRSGDRGEHGRKCRAERGNRHDDHDGDQSGDEAIFDGGDAGLIVDKPTEQITHD